MHRSGETAAGRLSRHPVDVGEIRSRVLVLEPHLAAKLAAARKNLILCNSLKFQALGFAGQTIVLDPESSEASRWLRIGSQAVVAIFQGATATNDDVEVQLGVGPLVRAPSTVTADLHDVGNWTDGFFMAAICREQSLLDTLCRVPMALLRGSATRSLEDSYLFADALQLHWKRQSESRVRALAALQAAERQDLPAPTVRATRELAVPQIRVFLCLLDGEAGRFNESLARALELHRQFWSHSESVARDPRGYFSLRLTGLAVLAHDAGMPVTVESDYLPMVLVRGDGRPPA